MSALLTISFAVGVGLSRIRDSSLLLHTERSGPPGGNFYFFENTFENDKKLILTKFQ